MATKAVSVDVRPQNPPSAVTTWEQQQDENSALITGAVPPTDPDDLALFEARQAAGMNGQAKPDALAAQPRSDPDQPAVQQPAPRAVPKWRFDQERSKVKALEDQVAFVQGQMAYLQANSTQVTTQPEGQSSGAQPTQQQPSVEQRILAEQNRVLACAQQFDAGEITLVEFKRIENDATNKINAVREIALADWMKAQIPAPQTALSDQERLQSQIAMLEAKHPWLTVMSDVELQLLSQQAHQELAALGKPLGKGPSEDMRLREYIGTMSDAAGPRWYPDHQPPQSRRTAAQPTHQTSAPPQQRPIDRKIELAQRHPPNMANAGLPADSSVITDATINAMSTDDIGDLPAALRQRYLQRME